MFRLFDCFERMGIGRRRGHASSPRCGGRCGIRCIARGAERREGHNTKTRDALSATREFTRSFNGITWATIGRLVTLEQRQDTFRALRAPPRNTTQLVEGEYHLVAPCCSEPPTHPTS